MLVCLFDDRMLEGVHAGWSGKVFSALACFKPMYASGGKAMFPRAKAAQSGWKKITTSRSRLPILSELACALAMMLMVMGRDESALLVLLCFALCLRPGGAHRIRTDHEVGPSKSASRSHM